MGYRTTYPIEANPQTSFLAHVLGWLLIVDIASLTVSFSLFQWYILVWLVAFIVVVLIIHSIEQVVRFNWELREKDVLEEKLKALASQAELKALRAQINPHFLFNSLNMEGLFARWFASNYPSIPW